MKLQDLMPGDVVRVTLLLSLDMRVEAVEINGNHGRFLACGRWSGWMDKDRWLDVVCQGDLNQLAGRPLEAINFMPL